MSFVAKVIDKKISITKCKKLFELGFRNNRIKILEMLQKAGFDTPSDKN